MIRCEKHDEAVWKEGKAVQKYERISILDSKESGGVRKEW